MFPDFRINYIVTVIKTVWYWHKNKHVHQWKKTENPEISPYPYGQLICDKGGKNIQWRKKILSSINGVGKTGQLGEKSEIRRLSNTIHKYKLNELKTEM